LPKTTGCQRACSLRQRLFLKSASVLASFTHATVRTDSGHSNQKTSRRSLQKEAACVLDRAAHWGCRFNHEPFAPKAGYQQAVYQQAVYNRFVCDRVKIRARESSLTRQVGQGRRILLPMLAIEFINYQRSPIESGYTARINAYAVRVRTRKVKRLHAARWAKRMASNTRAKTVRARLARCPLEVTERHYPMQKIFELTN